MNAKYYYMYLGGARGGALGAYRPSPPGGEVPPTGP